MMYNRLHIFLANSKLRLINNNHTFTYKHCTSALNPQRLVQSFTLPTTHKIRLGKDNSNTTHPTSVLNGP
ncbi:MAG: hypothetical protein DID91_2727703151 [Candidatus Nitrotoga sp. MKT]|nr:MAG: hypothetical protein DID91_2727703151 [Candidatus Nitrotoga sp. MKT]